MKKRIFVAINLPEKVKNRLKEYQEKYDYLLAHRSLGEGGPVRWTKEDSLHLTLVFIGYVTDDQMLEVCRTARQVAANFEPFLINFKRIILGPPGKLPRMIWVEGEISKELTDLKNKLEDAFLETESGFSRKENRPLKPHITLARIKMDKWQQLEPKPMAEEDFKAQVPVASIEVMESDLKNDGAEYVVLESCELGK